MKVSYNSNTGVFFTVTVYEERLIPRTAGFKWDPNQKVWFSADLTKVEAMVPYMDGAVKTIFQELKAKHDEELRASSAVDADLDLPRPEGLEYRGYQKAGIAYGLARDAVLIGDAPGLGKQQPLSEPVLTPSGWSTMGSLKVGDFVVGSEGLPVKVTGVFPQTCREVYAMTFSDGVVVRSGPEHLWTVRDSNRKRRGHGCMTVTTADLRSRGLLYSSTLKPKFEIPQFVGDYSRAHDWSTGSNFPWLIGQLLGNGYTAGKAVFVASNSIDQDVVARLRESGGVESGVYGGAHRVRFNQRDNRPLIEFIVANGMDVKSKEKRIPAVCLGWSFDHRVHLLRGLMDSDGSNSRNRIVFHTCSAGLAEDVALLARSLGGASVIREYDRTPEGKPIEWQVNIRTQFCPFFSARKSKGWKPVDNHRGNKIVSIERVADEDSVCIMVDSPDHLYVTTGYKLTHNTIQALGILNTDASLRKVLIICPVAVKLNWRREAQKWLTTKRSISIVSAKEPSLTASICIINHDMTSKFAKQLRAVTWDAIIIDESHLLKNPKTARAKAILGDYAEVSALKARRRICLSGTPAVNYPVEVWTQLNWLRPDLWPETGYASFKARYGYREAWDYNDRLAELQEKLRKNVMIRRLKGDVLKELPPKQRQVVVIPNDLPADLKAKNRALLSQLDGFLKHAKEAKAKATSAEEAQKLDAEFNQTLAGLKKSDGGWDFTEMSRIRHETAIAKVGASCAYIEELLEEGVGKLVVFGHHRDVLEDMAKHFPGQSAVYYGGQSADVRQATVDKFQDPKSSLKVLFISIIAGGVGITLTASSTCLFVEQDWVPGNMVQASDRLHRMGQLDSVMVQYLVYEESIDMRIAEVVSEKEADLDKAMNLQAVDTTSADEIAREKASAQAMADATRKVEEALALKQMPKYNPSAPKADSPADAVFPEHQVRAIRVGLNQVLQNDDDEATELNGVGFSKMDGGFARSLLSQPKWSIKQIAVAIKMVTKYRRQIDAVTYREAIGPQAVAQPNPKVGAE